MESKNLENTANVVFKDVFGQPNRYTDRELEELFAYDMPLPKKRKSSISGDYTWGTFAEGEKAASSAELMNAFAKEGYMRPKKDLNSVDDILKHWNEINVQVGEKYMESRDVEESDGVYNSSGVYRSQLIIDSQNIAFSYNNSTSKYLIGSRDNKACTFGIRMNQSIYCSSSYEVIWGKKISRSMYINNCGDLYECLFCANLSSKKYCVANMQFTKEEYDRIKQMVLKWTFEQFDKKLGRT